MTESVPRPEVVQALTAAHQDQQAALALVEVELRFNPTETERESARKAAVKAKETELLEMIASNERRARELREQFGDRS